MRDRLGHTPTGAPTGHLRSRWLTVDGLRLHARVDEANAPAGATPVVLVHGLVVSSRYLVPAAVQLAPYHRVYAPDLPGFGASAKPRRVLDVTELADALARWLDAIGLERVALLGNSFGCQIIVALAARHPQRVTRVVLNGPTVDPRARTPARVLVRLVQDTRAEGAAPGMMRDYVAASLRRAVRTALYMLQDRIEEKLPLVRAPALVVRGARDPIVPQRWAEEVTRLLPHGRLVVLPGLAHAVVAHGPLELVRVTRPFLAEEGTPHAAATRQSARPQGRRESPR